MTTRFLHCLLVLLCMTVIAIVPALAIEPPSDEEAAILRNSPDLPQRIERMNRLLEPLLNPEAIPQNQVMSGFVADLTRVFGLTEDNTDFTPRLDANGDKLLDERDFVDMALKAPEISRQACTSPTSGQAKCIVLPLKFPDVGPNPAHDSAYWQQMFFGTSFYTTHSFYVNISNGELDLGGDVLTNPDETDGYWVADNNKSYYTWDNDLLGEILDKADAYYDFSDYDADHNGEADGVYFIYAGATDGWGDFYWGWATYGGYTVDGIKVGPLMFVGEDLMTYRVAAHEFGHMMGLPDEYDYTFQSAGVGVWSLMGKGEAVMDAWCRYKLGWGDAQVIGMDTYDAPFTPRSEGGGYYRLWKLGASGPEYFLVEMVSPTLYDYQLPGGGIMIYHIDDTRSNNNDWTHKLVDVEEADGHDDLDHNNNQGDATDPYFPGNNVTFNYSSYPNSKSYAGADTLVEVINISTATADLIIGVPGDLPVDETEPNNVWNDSGVKPIPAPNADPDGKVDEYTDPSDFWRFTVSKPAIVDVTLNSHNDTVDLALIVRSLGGGGPVEIANTTWADEHCRAYVFVPGNHFIEVKAMRQAAYYDLSLSLEPLPDPGFVEIKSWPLLPDKIYDNTMTIPAMRFEILNRAGISQLQSLQLYTQGTYPSAIKNVELWLDNGDDVFGPGLDTLLAGPVQVTNSNKVVIPNINYGCGPYTVLFLTVDTADTAGGEQAAIVFQSYKDFHLSIGSIIYSNFPIESGVADVVDGPMPLCYVAAGDFKMGSDPANDPYYIGACDLNEETPVHQNRTGNYYVSRYEITNSQFAQFMTDGGYDNHAYWTNGGWNWKNNNDVTQPDSWNDPAYKIGDAYPDYPVAGVSYHECYAYSHYLGGRVPTEPEWEKAGRGTDGRIYTYGNTYDSGIYGAYDAYPIGSFHASDSLYGVSDLEGNIFEWVGTSWEWGVYQRYASGSFEPPAFYDYFMQRGYRYLIVGDCDTDYASRLSYRDTWPRAYRWTFLGFRVAFNPPV